MRQILRIKCLAFIIVAARVALLSQRALASVGGALQGGTVAGNPTGFNPCGSMGTLYINQTSGTMRHELSLTNFGACSTSFSRTDAAGNPQSINIDPNASSVVSTSLQAGGVLSWASSASTGFVNFLWELEQSPSQSIGMPSGSTAPQLVGASCGSTSVLYKNLTGASTTLNLSVTNSLSCTFAVSWTDASGHAHTIDLGLGGTQGVSTAIPEGGAITWTSGSGSAPISAGWRLERRVLDSLNP